MRKTIASLALVLGLATPSCIGPDYAYNNIRNWNASLTENKFVNELAFLGLNIIPVYSFALMGDYLIFNSIEFWSGNNVLPEPKEYENQAKLGESGE